MTQIIEHKYSQAIYPLHAVILAGTIPLFLSAALSDFAYYVTFEIQWINFASWLAAGGLLFGSIALIFTIIDLCRADRRAPGIILYAVILLVTWAIALFNALVHARDAWASMPTGLILSVIVVLLSCVATWFGFCTPRIGGTK